MQEAEYQPLDHNIKTRWTRTAFALFGLATVLLFFTQNMGWDVFRSTRVLGTMSHGFDEALAKVKLWPRWDVDLVSADIYNATQPAVGVTGSVTMKDGKTFPITFVQVDRPTAVVYQTKHSMGTTLDWYWYLVDADATGYTLRMGVKCAGPLSWVFGLALKNKCLEAFDKCLPEFKKVVEL
jgi:hypothetical protein